MPIKILLLKKLAKNKVIWIFQTLCNFVNFSMYTCIMKLYKIKQIVYRKYFFYIESYININFYKS